MKEFFLPQAVIARKRDGEVLEKAVIEQFVTALTQDRLSDAQVGAFAMAVFLKGMTTDECVALTIAMRDSGTVLKWDRDRLSGPIIDKHSTGGVGDCVSLMLAPMLAGCGAHVPMISGRGLGHTGGTLDKLSSIPGYDTEPETIRFRNAVEKIGCAIIGQTAQLAPADRRLYAVRDVTATVESIPLITSSILSKKLAADLDALVMDVKTGNGAVTEDPVLARHLAEIFGPAGIAFKNRRTWVPLLLPFRPCAGKGDVGALHAREHVGRAGSCAEVVPSRVCRQGDCNLWHHPVSYTHLTLPTKA